MPAKFVDNQVEVFQLSCVEVAQLVLHCCIVASPLVGRLLGQAHSSNASPDNLILPQQLKRADVETENMRGP